MLTMEAWQWRTITNTVLELPGLEATRYAITFRKDNCRNVAILTLSASSLWWKTVTNLEQKKYGCNCQTRLTTLLMNRSLCSSVYFLKMNVRLSCHFTTRLFKTPILKQFSINVSNTSFTLIQHLIFTMTIFIPSEGSMAPPFWLDAQNIFVLLSLLLLLNVPSWYVDWPYWSFPKGSSTRYISVAHW